MTAAMQSAAIDRNVFALRAVRDLIKRTPRRHNQTVWAELDYDAVQFDDGDTAYVSCGTSACVAGWAVNLAGAKFVVQRGKEDQDGGRTVYFCSFALTPGGEEQHIETYARQVLGLSEAEAGYLFDGDLERAEVLALLKALVKGDNIVQINGNRIRAEKL